MEGSVEQVEGYIGAAKRICAQSVSDIMTSTAHFVSPDESMRSAAALMSLQKLHRLPVVSGDGKVVGIITASDVMQDMLHLVRNLPAGTKGKISP
jgi:CBS domain-containing protein